MECSRMEIAMSEHPCLTTVTFVGHSTVLLEARRHSIITDPVFSDRLASVFTRRETPMDFDIDSIANLDAILVSHGHHDHLDLRSLKALGKSVPVLLPMGMSLPLILRGFKDIRVMRPWDDVRVGESWITAVPSHHFGGRPPFYFTAGFQGYVISSEKCIYFAGDTGLDEKMFSEIGKRFDLDLAILPIGAYHPPSFRKNHMSPEDAIEAFRLLRAKYMMAVHFETFSMSWEPLDEPRARLAVASEKEGLSSSVFALRSGESICLEGEGARRSERPTPSSGRP
jgi:L-ascorbate metabolism protein UlaG (beta-lactamase superfamily)